MNKPGYHYANLRESGKTKPFAVHRLVAEAFFHSPQPAEVVDHKNGNKLDNRLDNLRIATRSENTVAFRDRARHQGKHGYKLNEKDVAEIKRLIAAGDLTQKQIAEQFGMSQGVISAIKLGRKWKHVT